MRNIRYIQYQSVILGCILGVLGCILEYNLYVCEADADDVGCMGKRVYCVNGTGLVSKHRHEIGAFLFRNCSHVVRVSHLRVTIVISQDALLSLRAGQRLGTIGPGSRSVHTHTYTGAQRLNAHAGTRGSGRSSCLQ